LTPSPPTVAIELWHPDGVATRRVTLDASSPTGEGDGPADVIVVAPDVALEEALVHATGQLAPDGIAWIVISPRRRARAARLIARAGLEVRGEVLLVPGWPASEHLVGLVPGAVRDAARRRLGAGALRSWLAGTLTATPPGRVVLRHASPGIALIAGRPGDRPALAWLGELDGRPVAGATVSTGVRRDAPVGVVLRFAGRTGAPDLAVKVGLGSPGRERIARERHALATIAPDAARAGVRVPTLTTASATWLIATDVIAGHPVAARHSEAVAADIAAWLLDWNRATLRPSPAAPDDLVEASVGRLLAAGVVDDAYARAVTELADAAGCPRVAAHNDLTLANVLVRRGSLAVVDWESAAAHGLPLTDLWYLLADAHARARGVTHATAVQRLLDGGDPAAVREHRAALRLTPRQAELAFHACWIMHADDELARGTSGAFTDVVRAVAERHGFTPGLPSRP